MSKHEIIVVDADEAQIAPMSAPLLNVGDYFGVIKNDAHLEEAATHVRGINTVIKFIRNVLDEPCAMANKLHKMLTGNKSQAIGPLEAKKRIATLAIRLYHHQKEQAAALLQAEAETNERVEAEAAQAEQVMALADDPKAAQAVAEAPIAVYTPPPAPIAKPVGVCMTKRSTYKIVKVGLIPLEWWMLDEKKIAAHGREHKAAACIPGVEFSYE